MPNRIIREAILSSEKIAGLGWPEEVFYRRLMSIVDDYGRTEANPQYLRSRCYPLQTDTVRVADITRWTAACQTAGVILSYAVDGKQYLEVINFQQQQRSASKCPAPPLLANDINCSQLLTSAHLGVVVGVSVVEGESGAATPKPKRGKQPEQTLRSWLTALGDELAISADDPIYEWADKTGIPADWLGYAWWTFEARYIVGVKTYADWRAVFRKACREDWLKIWRYDSGQSRFVLTTAGESARREMESL